MPQRVDKAMPTELRADTGERAVVAMISTTSVDRVGDVMLPQGVDLGNFWKLPTVFFNHDSTRLPVGRVPKGGIRKLPNAIEAKAHMLERPKSLPSNIEWQPDTLLDLFQMGAPLAFSVGFNIKKARFATKKDRERFGEGAERVISDWELIEFSVVPVPANQDALMVAVSKCHVPVGPHTLGALGLRRSAKVRIVPRARRRFKLEGYLPGERLKV
jgi:hypothetical protein